MGKLTVEQLEIMIYAMRRSPVGGYTKLIKENSEELAGLLEEYVLPILECRENAVELDDDEFLWDGIE
jgi:hypothetical protein